MQDVHTFRRCLLPPGRVAACTVWTLGFHRRLVRRWEWDTDLPKPGPFPQMSHTAAMVETPQKSGVRRLAHRSREQPGSPGLIQNTDCRAHRQNGQQPPRADKGAVVAAG